MPDTENTPDAEETAPAELIAEFMPRIRQSKCLAADVEAFLRALLVRLESDDSDEAEDQVDLDALMEERDSLQEALKKKEGELEEAEGNLKKAEEEVEDDFENFERIIDLILQKPDAQLREKLEALRFFLSHSGEGGFTADRFAGIAHV